MRLRWLAVFVALLLAASAAPVLADPGSGPAPGSQGGEGREPLPSPEVFANALGQAERENERREEAFEAELASPQAQREREASRQAHADASGVEAQGLLASAFPEALRELNADPARTLSQLDIEKTLSAHTARVSNEEGGSELVESSTPIEVGSGAERAPVDLSLERSGGSFVSRNPVTGVQLPDSASGEVRLEDGVGFDGLPGEGDPSAHRFGEAALFFPSTDRSTDTLLAPKTHGVEVMEQLRSAESPEQFRYPLSLPAGAKLQAGEYAGAEVLGAAGQTIATVPAPSALDAQGAEVPVTLSVEGDSLVVEIQHRSRDVAYPILLDPELVDNVSSGTAGFGFWTQNQVGSGYQLLSPAGSLQVRAVSGFFPAATYGQFIFQAPGSTAFIHQAQFSSIFGFLIGCQSDPEPHGYVGIFNVFTGLYQPQGIFSLSTSPTTPSSTRCRRAPPACGSPPSGSAPRTNSPPRRVANTKCSSGGSRSSSKTPRRRRSKR